MRTTLGVLILSLTLSFGCAFGMGAVVDEDGATCKGVFFAFGQSDACGIDGDALSVPGLNAIGRLVCGAQSAVATYMGREAPACAAVEDESG